MQRALPPQSEVGNVNIQMGVQADQPKQIIVIGASVIQIQI